MDMNSMMLCSVQLRCLGSDDDVLAKSCIPPGIRDQLPASWKLPPAARLLFMEEKKMQVMWVLIQQYG